MRRNAQRELPLRLYPSITVAGWAEKTSQKPAFLHLGQGPITGTVIGEMPPLAASWGDSIASK